MSKSAYGFNHIDLIAGPGDYFKSDKTKARLNKVEMVGMGGSSSDSEGRIAHISFMADHDIEIENILKKATYMVHPNLGGEWFVLKFSVETPSKNWDLRPTNQCRVHITITDRIPAVEYFN